VKAVGAVKKYVLTVLQRSTLPVMKYGTAIFVHDYELYFGKGKKKSFYLSSFLVKVSVR
jgi:hypothetical protein